jgi:hypothetical protein
MDRITCDLARPATNLVRRARRCLGVCALASALLLAPILAMAAPTRPAPRAVRPAPAKKKVDLRPHAAPKSAKPSAESIAKPKTTPAGKAPAAAAKPSKVLDFDADDVEGRRLEPGYELIEAGPRKARHHSLVTPLRPEDSVVRRE